MEIGETIYVTTREEFREWLEKNHKTCKEIWLIQYKKFTNKPSIPYVDAVEEAINALPNASRRADKNPFGRIQILSARAR
jgi:hypothetical protein